MDIIGITSTTCRNAADGAVIYKESGIESSCFTNTGTGVCEGTCVPGFTESSSCLLSGTAMAITPAPASGGAAGNPSCPASPPTPAPTLPPVQITTPAPVEGGIPSGPVPGVTATIPPGNPGAGGPAPAGAPGSSPDGSSPSGGSGGSSGGSDGNGGGGGGGSSSANNRQMSHLVGIGSALLLARLLHRMMF